MLKHESIPHCVTGFCLFFSFFEKSLSVKMDTAVLIRLIRFKKKETVIIYVQFGAAVHNHVNVELFVWSNHKNNSQS